MVIQSFVIQYLLDAVVIADNLELLILVPSWSASEKPVQITGLL